jgi:hypothetical protein
VLRELIRGTSADRVNDEFASQVPSDCARSHAAHSLTLRNVTQSPTITQDLKPANIEVRDDGTANIVGQGNAP